MAADDASGSFDPMAIAGAVVGANASVATLVILGIVATYVGIWDKQGISDLGKLVFNMSMPALVFSKVIVQISWTSLQSLWILPVFCVLHILSGYVIFKFINIIFGLKGADGKAAMGCSMFGNCGSLAIAVMGALCTSEDLAKKMHGTEACTATGVSYCAFYVIAWNICIWGLGDAMLFPEEEDDKSVTVMPVEDANKPLMTSNSAEEGDDGPCVSNRKSITLKAPEERWRTASTFAEMEEVEPKENNNNNNKKRNRRSVFKSKNNDVQYTMKLTPEAMNEVVSRMPITGGMYGAKVDEGPKVLSKWSITGGKITGFFKQLSKSPPIRAAGLAIALGICPQVKALLCDVKDANGKMIENGKAPLGFIMIAMNQMGNAQVPVSMVMLSGSGTLRYLEKLKQAAKAELESQTGEIMEMESFNFSTMATIVILFGRLVIMPFVGLFWWWLFCQMQWFPHTATDAVHGYGKGMLGFICLIEACVPTAQSIVTMFIVHGDIQGGGAIAELILIQYALSVVFFSAAAAYFEYLTLSF